MCRVIDLAEFDLGGGSDAAEGGEYKEAGGGDALVDGANKGGEEVCHGGGRRQIIVGVWGGNKGNFAATLNINKTNNNQLKMDGGKVQSLISSMKSFIPTRTDHAEPSCHADAADAK